MNEELLKTLDNIEQDLRKLDKRNDLTEYGEGQLDLITIIRKVI